MATSAQVWWEKGLAAFVQCRAQLIAYKDLNRSRRRHIARRFIAHFAAYPHLVDDGAAARPSYVIDLGIIRKALAGRWPVYADLIHRLTARAIERHLGDDDTYKRRGDCYVLNLAGLPPLSGAERVIAMATSLAADLFGDEAVRPSAPATRQPSVVELIRDRQWPYLGERLRAVPTAVQHWATDLFAFDSTPPGRRGATAAEPRILAATSAWPESMAATATPIHADLAPPSRSHDFVAARRDPANDETTGAFAHGGTAFVIAADFRPPSEPVTEDAVDLDQPHALECAMKAAVARLSHEAAPTDTILPYRRAQH